MSVGLIIIIIPYLYSILFTSYTYAQKYFTSQNSLKFMYKNTNVETLYLI